MHSIKWIKPELIILMRNHPEETLQGVSCKHPGYDGPITQLETPACAEQGTKCETSASGNGS